MSSAFKKELSRREGLAWAQLSGLVDSLHARVHLATDDVNLAAGRLPHFEAPTDEVLGEWESKTKAMADCLYEIRLFKQVRDIREEVGTKPSGGR